MYKSTSDRFSVREAVRIAWHGNISSFDENGDILAFMEVGINYDSYVQENNSLYKNIMIISSEEIFCLPLRAICGCSSVQTVYAEWAEIFSQLQ